MEQEIRRSRVGLFVGKTAHDLWTARVKPSAPRRQVEAGLQTGPVGTMEQEIRRSGVGLFFSGRRLLVS
jgi:hypothetical protein